MDKTVYILGAGFSMDAGAPSQAKILEEIYELKKLPKHKQMIHQWIDGLDAFFKQTLKVSDSEKNYYSLEDIYTPIDRSIDDVISFKGYVPTELAVFRDNLNRLIILAIRNAVEREGKSRAYIEKFAKHLVGLSKARLKDEKNDTVSVITTNWDIMLDNCANNILKKERLLPNQKFLGVIDYCCYISSLKENDKKIKPGLYAIGKGGYNLKILKLHGSLNWLQCPKCQRLYVIFYERWTGGYVFEKKYCRHCKENFGAKDDKTNRLSTNMIMPTFIKNLENVQTKLIWQNAGIEMSEASKIVFLGYSLPQADFEFKQLMSRMIRPNAKIQVVLTEKDDPLKHIGDDQYLTAGHRFTNFFSGRSVDVAYTGVQEYVNNL